MPWLGPGWERKQTRFMNVVREVMQIVVMGEENTENKEISIIRCGDS